MRVSYILIRLVVLVQNPWRLIITQDGLNFVFILLLCLTTNIVVAQNNNQAPIPVKEEETNFQCDIVMDIYDAFYDWTTNTSWGGMGLPLLAEPKFTKGALCLANKNDTNGNDVVDKDETNISANGLGRNEIDLMKLVIRPRDISISLSGNISLTKATGGPAIKLWRTSNKALSTDEVVLPATINTNELPLTLYIEALEPSESVRDIVLTASYGSKQDVVKATAYWVELVNTYGETSDDPDLVGLGVNDCIISNISLNSQGASSKYGFGKFLNNTKLGGRILFEWLVKPSDPLAYDLISIDGTRQRSTKNWSVDMNLTTGPDCKFVLKEAKFPFADNLDNELPNDDAYHKDKTNCNYQITSEGKYFTWDAPNIRLNEESGASPLYRAFVDDKTNFLEYIRIAPKGYNFNPPPNDAPGKLLGSRASDKIEWANARYTRKNDQFYLDLDNTEYGFNHVRVNLEEDHNNYPFSYNINSISQPYLGSYTAFINTFTQGEYSIVLTIEECVGCDVVESHSYAVPKNLEFDLNFDNHSLKLNLFEHLPSNSARYFIGIRSNLSIKPIN